MRPTEKIHHQLPPLRLVNRRTAEYVGPCPRCGGDDTSDRFHVWMVGDSRRPARRFWCRACGASGMIDVEFGPNSAAPASPRPAASRQPSQHSGRAVPQPTHISFYRQLYSIITAWAQALLQADYNPEPLAYLHERGLDAATIAAAQLGHLPHNPHALPDHLRKHCPDLLPYTEGAGVLIQRGGQLVAHPNLRGSLLFPYLDGDQVTDLRTRTFPGKGYRSLAGGYELRGAVTPFLWGNTSVSETVIITEGEFKALAATQAYHDNRLSAPAIAHPGLSYWREEWGDQLLARGVNTVILAYDSQPRLHKDGQLQLTPEEAYTIRHGLRLQQAGLRVRVLRLPLARGEEKSDLDAFLLAHGSSALERLLCAAPTLADYHASLPRELLLAANLPLAGLAYPTRRSRPRRIKQSTTLVDHRQPISLEQARAEIPDLVREHALAGEGLLVLAHPPGTGKGHGTVTGLRSYLQEHRAPSPLVWTAPRRNQVHDQPGIELIPLHGRNQGNCRKFGEAQTLAKRGYPVLNALCQRRCPYVDSCSYLRQFNIEADRFAAQPLLLATGWWQEAGVLVLDEFDIAQLTQIVTLDSRDLALIKQATADPHAQAVLSWLGSLLVSSGGRALRGSVLLAELEELAKTNGHVLNDTLLAAERALPSENEQALLTGLPRQATLAEYEALPPAHLPALVKQLGREARMLLGGKIFTSRLELRDGQLQLLLRHDHLHDQLARSGQPKLILDATVSEGLLRAVFPQTPLQIIRPHIPIPARVAQVLDADWAKSTLQHSARRTRWYNEIVHHIRPDRPTLVVCTQECESELRTALAARGHSSVEVAHYGALRGSNNYIGYDVILAQVYHPNLEALLREGKALFANEPTPLDECLIIEERLLSDGAGETWAIQVPTFADPRLRALLERRREAEMAQCALRGRPFDHPSAQITLLFSLPLPDLAPTEIVAPRPSPTSNGGRKAAAMLKLTTAVQVLLTAGQESITVNDLAAAANVSVVTVREHWHALAAELNLCDGEETIWAAGRRAYRRRVLHPAIQERFDACSSTDQTRNKALITRLICADPHPDHVGDTPVRSLDNTAALAEPDQPASDDGIPDTTAPLEYPTLDGELVQPDNELSGEAAPHAEHTPLRRSRAINLCLRTGFKAFNSQTIARKKAIAVPPLAEVNGSGWQESCSPLHATDVSCGSCHRALVQWLEPLHYEAFYFHALVYDPP